MARRKAEVVEKTPQWASEAERIEAMPDRWAEPKAESEDWAAQKASVAQSGRALALAATGVTVREARLDHIERAMHRIPSMTDRAAINALAEAVADLARLMR